MATDHSVDVDPARWQKLLDEVLGRVAGRFARVDLRWRVRAFVRGLLADLPRKNCWTIAEHAGDPTPEGMQHLLGRAVWDQDAVRDDIRDYVTEHLAVAKPASMPDIHGAVGGTAGDRCGGSTGGGAAPAGDLRVAVLGGRGMLWPWA